jgi:hypothetical protein
MEDVGKGDVITRNVKVVVSSLPDVSRCFQRRLVAVEGVPLPARGWTSADGVRQIFDPVFHPKTGDKGSVGVRPCTALCFKTSPSGSRPKIGVGTTLRLYFPRMSEEVTVTVQKREKSPAGLENHSLAWIRMLSAAWPTNAVSARL